MALSKRATISVAAALLVLACGGRPERVDVVPVYRLSVTPVTVSWLSSEQPIAVVVEDSRGEEAGLIGQNIEESEAVPIHESPKGASELLVTDALEKELAALGGRVVESGAANRVLRVKLLKLWIQEDNTYNGELRVRVQVVDPSGTVLADVLAVGTAKRFGRSLSVENYQETIESMLQNMMENLFQNVEFQKAFSTDSANTPTSADADASTAESDPKTAE